jgi:CDP-diacylglycerol--glycerol-3-phosphate 3-phosphatidyltransferase
MPGRDPLPNWDQYATRWTALHGGVDPRRARAMIGFWQRSGYEIAKVCARVRIRPTGLTFTGLGACLAVPFMVGHGTGGLFLAAGLVLLAAVTDTVDGALAVVTSHATKLGYVYDSVVDRIGEVCWLIALWLLGASGYLAVAAGALAWLHEYTRARANAAGMREIGASTLGERPTRVLLTFIGFALGALVGLANPDMLRGLATFVVAVWCVIALIGFLQLFASIHKALAGRNWPMWQPAPPPVAPPKAGSSQAGSSTAAPPTVAPPTATPLPVAPAAATAATVPAAAPDPTDEELRHVLWMPSTTTVYTSRAATEPTAE